MERKDVRALVEKNNEELRQFQSEGGDIHQLSLDQMDRAKVLAGGMSEDDAIRFWELYTEETNAMASEIEQRTRVLLQKAHVQESHAAAIGGFFVLVVGIIVMAIFFAR